MNSTRIRFGLVPVLLLASTGCGRSGHSPSLDVLGSYFPAWMFCILIGLALTFIARLLVVAFKLDSCVRPAAIVYPCLMTVFIMTVWLLFFQN